MFNVCPSCGQYCVDKRIEGSGRQALAICPECDHAQAFLRLPLFWLTGASATGKSAAGLQLLGDPEFIILELDIFWIEPLQANMHTRLELILRTCKNIAQGGKPILLVGSSLPQHLESSLERRYFSAMHYLALVCEPDIQAARLRARPSWRNFDTEKVIQDQVSFNQWFWDHHADTDPPIDLLDTSHAAVRETANHIKQWLSGHQPD